MSKRNAEGDLVEVWDFEPRKNDTSLVSPVSLTFSTGRIAFGQKGEERKKGEGQKGQKGSSDSEGLNF